jgi:hypothetical protein
VKPLLISCRFANKGDIFTVMSRESPPGEFLEGYLIRWLSIGPYGTIYHRSPTKPSSTGPHMVPLVVILQADQLRCGLNVSP